MKTSSQEDRGSECLSLTRWKSLHQSADDYKIVDILFSQPRNGKQSSPWCQRASSASIRCYKFWFVAASKHQLFKWNSKSKCVCWRRVKKITCCINADAGGFSTQSTAVGKGTERAELDATHTKNLLAESDPQPLVWHLLNIQFKQANNRSIELLALGYQLRALHGGCTGVSRGSRGSSHR